VLARFRTYWYDGTSGLMVWQLVRVEFAGIDVKSQGAKRISIVKTARLQFHLDRFTLVLSDILVWVSHYCIANRLWFLLFS
jgi:hypothetical protein